MKARVSRAAENGGPHSPDRAAIRVISATTVGFAAFALYLRTLSPSVGYSDSGELTAAAAGLGVPHPPGFPLYVLLTHPLTLLPFGTAGQRLNGASALFAALTAAAVVWLTLTLLRSAGRGAMTTVTERAIAAITAGCVFATLRTPWAYATIAEVYALAICLALAVWLLVWSARLKTAALIYGLAMGVHPAINLAALPALGVFAYFTRRKEFFRSCELMGLAAIALLGVGVYGFLPIAASQHPVLNWGDPSSIDRFWAHISGSQYRTNVQLGFDGFARALTSFVAIFWSQNGRLTPLMLLLAAIGAVFAYRVNRAAFWMLLVWAGANIALSAAMNAGWPDADHDPLSIAEDLDAYYLPTLAVAAIFAGFGTASLAGRNRILAGLAPVIVGSALVANWSINDRSGDAVPRNYARDTLAAIAPDGLLLLRDWQLSSPLLYAQAIERERPDVIAIDLTLLERRWYALDVSRRHRPLFANASAELEAYLNRLSVWEADPDTVTRDPSRAREIETAFHNLVLSLLVGHAKSHRVYATREVTLAIDGQGKALARAFDERYQFVPQGLVFELRGDPNFTEPDGATYALESLSAAERRLGANHVVAIRIAPTYREMTLNRGLYLARHQRCDQAVSVLQVSLQHESTRARARAALDSCAAR